MFNSEKIEELRDKVSALKTDAEFRDIDIRRIHSNISALDENVTELSDNLKMLMEHLGLSFRDIPEHRKVVETKASE